MNLIGVDYGRRRIGLAVADTDTGFIKGLSTLDRQKNTAPIQSIVRLAQQESAQRFVVGLALDSMEQDTAMSREARAFGEELTKAGTCPVDYIDESFSSVEADRLMLDRTRSFRRQKGNRDRIAACLILQCYLREHQT